MRKHSSRARGQGGGGKRSARARDEKKPACLIDRECGCSSLAFDECKKAKRANMAPPTFLRSAVGVDGGQNASGAPRGPASARAAVRARRRLRGRAHGSAGHVPREILCGRAVRPVGAGWDTVGWQLLEAVGGTQENGNSSMACTRCEEKNRKDDGRHRAGGEQSCEADQD